MNYWITSDTHLGHDKMVEYCMRPQDHSEVILNNLKKMDSKPGDVLIHLGDICIGNEEIWQNELYRALSEKGLIIWLTKGNHDKKSDKWYLERVFHFVCETFTINMYGLNILFSHKPIKDNGYDLNIHGHFHNSDHKRHEPELVAIKNNKQFLYAQEYEDYRPITLKSIIRRFKD